MIEINPTLIAHLIAEQFPHWAHLPIRPVDLSGWDNRTFRLGEEMLVRLPSAECYASKVKIEQKWLPLLAPHLSFPIPKPITMGKPSKDYPWHWSVYRWIEGKSANSLTLDDCSLQIIASQLAQFLNELHKIDVVEGPRPGPHNFYRGDHISVYDAETKSALAELEKFIDVKSATSVWEKALNSRWSKNPVWIHGDFSSGNILIRDRQLKAVIDFGGMGVGDPACDLVIIWTFLKNDAQKIFKERINLDDDTWFRARGWALWKALITLISLEDKISLEAIKQQQIINQVLN